MKYLIPILWIIVFQLVGGAIGYATVKETGGWYDELTKSALNPPDYLFGIVWPILYVMIALAGYFTWRNRQVEGGRTLFLLFVLYTVLNWGWSFIFFTGHQILLGFIWIVFLDLVAVTFIALSRAKNRNAALLMILPLVWTCFAAYLNFEIWRLN